MLFQNQIYNEVFYAVALSLLIIIVGRLLLFILQKISEKTKITADDRIYRGIKNPVLLIIASFGIYTGINILSFLKDYRNIIDKVFATCFIRVC